MPKIGDKYVNPFFQEVNGNVKNELNTRGALYGARVRGLGVPTPSNSVWSYQKIAYGRVRSRKFPAATLGLPGSKIMSDRDGNLTLYSASRNVPKRPLLTSIDISNEGTMGSLLKGKFSFIAFPVLNNAGFSLGEIDKAFFTPGNEVEISFGWSVAANNRSSCSFEFTGIIFSFNWSFNGDMSITADVSIVSPSAIALGTSGDQSMPSETEDKFKPKDPKDIALEGNNISTRIDQDLARFKDKQAGDVAIAIEKNDAVYDGVDGLFRYIGIKLPIQESNDNEAQPTSNAASNTTPPKKIDKTIWYVTLGSITEYMNELVLKFEQSESGATAVAKGLASLYVIKCQGNETAYNEAVQSAYPMEVFFADSEMGAYGTIKPFPTVKFLTDGVQSGTINIGNILLGTDYVKETYNKFLDDTSTNITLKNITSFITELISKINRASGDIYQLTAHLMEDPNTTNGSGGFSERAERPDKAILTIEDANIPKQHTDAIANSAYNFDGRIFKPLIKSVQISSSPPKEMAAAAFTAAREGGVKPSNADNTATVKRDKDEIAFGKEEKAALEAREKALETAATTGFSDTWSETFRGALVAIKRFRIGGEAHWLNQALYPVNFSVTIDGINGFKFGDTIKTNLAPSKYSDAPYKLLFTVTKINHSIKDGVWETTLNTAARLNMG